MAIKTKPTNQNVYDFIQEFVDSKQKQEDSVQLIEIIRRITGYEPKMWGPSIIGFGSYHYKSTRSKQEGDWPLIGFSPRKAALSLYVYSGDPKHEYLLENLGKFTMGKACIYVKKLSDINMDVLIHLIEETLKHMKEHYHINH